MGAWALGDDFAAVLNNTPPSAILHKSHKASFHPQVGMIRQHPRLAHQSEANAN
jgi:hypothetical protein